jgi:hypothetical protein
MGPRLGSLMSSVFARSLLGGGPGPGPVGSLAALLLSEFLRVDLEAVVHATDAQGPAAALVCNVTLAAPGR